MKTVVVEYTVRPDYVNTNKENIKAVMDELHGMGDVGVQYFASVKEDGKSFAHIVVQRDEAAAQVMPQLASFKHFREQLNTGLEVKPQRTDMELVGKSFDL